MVRFTAPEETVLTPFMRRRASGSREIERPFRDSDISFGTAYYESGRLPLFVKYALENEAYLDVFAFVQRIQAVQTGRPVRRVKPELVFELALEAIQRSSRHRSGIAVRFPRMARRRTDKKPADADNIET